MYPEPRAHSPERQVVWSVECGWQRRRNPNTNIIITITQQPHRYLIRWTHIYYYNNILLLLYFFFSSSFFLCVWSCGWWWCGCDCVFFFLLINTKKIQTTKNCNARNIYLLVRGIYKLMNFVFSNGGLVVCLCVSTPDLTIGKRTLYACELGSCEIPWRATGTVLFLWKHSCGIMKGTLCLTNLSRPSGTSRDAWGKYMRGHMVWITLRPLD